MGYDNKEDEKAWRVLEQEIGKTPLPPINAYQPGLVAKLMDDDGLHDTFTRASLAAMGIKKNDIPKDQMQRLNDARRDTLLAQALRKRTIEN
jgi:hypothetical protein